ncbi:MAG: putative Ig domain-containing protein [Vicinamibacterales bacterium]
MSSLPLRRRSTRTLAFLVLALAAAVLPNEALGAGGELRAAHADSSAQVPLEPQTLLEGDAVPDLILTPSSGSAPVRILDGVTGAELIAGFPLGTSFTGGIYMAAGDLTGDNVPDLVMGTGQGGGLVTLIDGRTIASLGGGYPFGTGFTGGVAVAVGDVNGDGRNDIITAPARGGGTVVVFNGVNYTPIMSVAPFGPGYGGGLNVAAGDVDGDGRADLLVGQATGGEVAVVNAATQAVIAAAPFGPVNGVFVTAGDVTGDGVAEAIISPGSGNGPVIVFNLVTMSLVRTFVPFQPGPDGVRVAAGDLNGDGLVEIITVPGPGVVPMLRAYDGATNALVRNLPVYAAPFSSGVYVAVPVATGIRFTTPTGTTFQSGQAGSFTIRTSASPQVTAITMTGTLPEGVTFTDNGNGTATLAGTPSATARGTYPLALTAVNGVAAPAQQTFTITVNQPPSFASAASTAFGVGVPGTFTIATLGSPRPAITVSGTLPAGITFHDNDNGSATLSGTPANGTLGTYPLTLTATNGVGSPATQNFVLTVQNEPIFTSPDTALFNVAAPGTFTVTTSAAPAVTSIVRTGALPVGLTFTYNGNGTATIAGTPGAASGGTYALTITASNGVGVNATQGFTLSVTGAPQFTSAAGTTFVAGSAGSFTVTAAGGPPPAISLAGSLPAGVTFVNNGNGTATIAGTPNAGSGGSYPVTLTATNGVGTPATQNFVLTVNQAPAITSANAVSFSLNTASTFTVTATGVPAPTISVTGALPAGITVTPNGNGTATIGGTTAGPAGTYPLSIQASNGVGTPATQNFTLTITTCTVVNILPAAGALTAGTYNVAYSQLFTATGGSGHAFSISAGALPPGLTLSSGGSLTGTPSTTGTFNFTVSATAAGTCGGSSAYSLVVAPNAQNETYAGGVGNTQYSVGAGTPATPAVVVSGSVLNNDQGPGGLSAGPALIASTNGGQVSMAANGTFLYTPAAGFAGASDTFTYTLTDGLGHTNTAVVTIGLNGVVWYVNASAGAGDGRSHSPFSTMTAAATAAQAGHVIYVHPGSPTGATVLKAGQRLQGAGEVFSQASLTIAAGAAPTLTGTVTLADNAVVRALTVNAGTSASIAGTGMTGAESLTNVTIAGGSPGLSLTNVGGTFAMTGGGISGVGSGGGVVITGGTGGVTIAAPITTASGRSVTVQNRTAGTVTFSAAIADTGTGILLTSNTGSTIAFTGGLALSTGANAAFTATGGGTITATQNNTTIVNTIANTTATALTVSNTQIGAAGLTFRSIASNGGTSAGIVLENTGVAVTNGGLTVTGDGSAGSGGTISGKNGANGSLTQGIGISLQSTRNAVFSRMLIQSMANSAVMGRNVHGFQMDHSTISSAGSSAGVLEGPVVFGAPNPGGGNGVQGTALFRDTTIAGGIEHNVAFYGQSGTMSLQIDRDTANPADCKIEENSGAFGAHGVFAALEGTAVGTVTIDLCLVRGNRDAAVHATALGSSNLTLTVMRSDIGRTGQGDRGVVMTNGDDATLRATVTENNFYELTGEAVQLGQVPGAASALSLLEATITSNVLGTADPVVGNTLLATLGGSPGAASRTRLHIADNGTAMVSNHYGFDPAMQIEITDAASAAQVDLTVAGNHHDMKVVNSGGPTAHGPLGLVVRNTQAAAANMCANIGPNTFHWQPIPDGTAGGISVEQGGGSTFRLERGTQSLATPAATVLAANNGPYSSLPGSTTALSGSVLVVENGTCALPGAP